MRVLWAFFRKDLLTAASYRSVLPLGTLSMFMFVFIYVYEARLVPPNTPALVRYGTGYFAYALLGTAIAEFVAGWLRSLSDNLREAQLAGTLETVMCSPISSGLMITAMMAWPVLSMAALSSAYLVIGGFLVGLGLGGANWPAAAAIALLAFAAFAGLSLMSAGFVLVFKKGDPISMFVLTVGHFLCGAFFPVEFLPAWLRRVAALLPLTPAIEGIRLALFRGATLQQLGSQWRPLSAMAALCLLLGLLSMRAAFHHVRVRGGFTHY
jgi:ABC-2 type transport system permease protein